MDHLAEDQAVSIGEKDLQQARQKCRNELFLSAAIMSQETVYRLMRVVFVCGRVIYTEHSLHASSLRDPELVYSYFLAFAKAKFMDTMMKAASVLQDPLQLADMGLETDTSCLPPLAQLRKDKEFLYEQDTIARQSFPWCAP